MKVGGVELKNGKIVDLIVEGVPSIPSFDSNNEGQFTFSKEDGVLRFNNGESLVALNSSINENPKLKNSLGGEWLNGDLSFNPSAFNELSTIAGLTSESSLFDVISQMDSVIAGVSNVTLDEIDVSDVSTTGMGIVAFLAGSLIVLSLGQILQGSELSLTFDNLEDFNVTSTQDGNMLSFNSSGKLVSRKVRFEYTSLASNLIHAVTHNLGYRYCTVFCVNPANNQVVIPDDIVFDSKDQLTITLPSSTPLKALITTFN